MVPRCFIVTVGPLLLKWKQNNENNARSFEKKTMNLGSSWAGVPGLTLKFNKSAMGEIFLVACGYALIINSEALYSAYSHLCKLENSNDGKQKLTTW